MTISEFREKSCYISLQFPEHEGEDMASQVVGGVLKVSLRAQPSAACSLPDQSLQKMGEETPSDVSRFVSTHVTCIGVSSPSLMAWLSSSCSLNWREEGDKRKTLGPNRWQMSENSEADSTWIALAWTRSPPLKADIRLLMWLPK